MIPSSRWFPSGLQNQAAWFENFTTQFTALATGLGFAAGDVTAVGKDNDVMQFAASSTIEADVFVKALREYRRIITEGEIGEPTPNVPANPALTAPAPVATGIFERLNDLVDRIRVAPTYTNEAGVLLGIVPSKSDPLAPEAVKPAIKVFPASSDYHFSVVVEKREKSDMWKVEIRRLGQEKWQDVKTASGKSVDVHIEPTTDGAPEQLQVRVRLIKNNEDYGQLSDVVYVTVNP